MKIDQNIHLKSLIPEPGDKQPDRRKLKNACDDFEALFIARMLQEMRKTTAEGSEGGTQKYADAFQSLFDWEISRTLAQRGSIGISDALMKNIETNEMEIEPGTGVSKLSSSEFDDIINEAAGVYDVDSDLVRSIIACESDGDPYAVSPRNARGLMQLMDETAHDMGVSDPYDPVQNIHGGTAYLRQLLDSFDGNLDNALAAYNAGPGAVRRHGGIPPYRETIDYVNRVKSQYYASHSTAPGHKLTNDGAKND